MKDICEELIILFSKNGIIDQQGINSETDLFEECGLDSLKLIDLIVCIEEKYDFEFLDEDLPFENFTTITNIARIIKKRTVKYNGEK